MPIKSQNAISINYKLKCNIRTSAANADISITVTFEL